MSDSRVKVVGQALYEQERANSNVAQFWPEWSEAPEEVIEKYESRAVEILELVDSF